MATPLVGIFVGGQARRMGGVAKGLLPAPESDEPLVARLARIAREALPRAEVVLVGRAEAYASLALPALADDPPGVGPIGGLAALCEEGLCRGAPFVLAVACDLPFVSAELLTRLAALSPGTACVAPRQAERWQPLCAVYEPRATLAVVRGAIANGESALQRVVEALAPVRLELSSEAELEDWDEPGDVC
jgi:molybdopterin-guanine dinucleotide biosynthesis protein A